VNIPEALPICLVLTDSG